MAEYKPIETHYDGYRFRSRLEARIAVFLKAMGWEYYYEPEGFVFPDGTCYLPDFYLPEIDTYVEAKGVMTEEDKKKILLLASTGVRVAVIYPDMTFQVTVDWNGSNVRYQPSEGRILGACLDIKMGSTIARCTECGKMFFASFSGYYMCRACDAYDGDHYFDPIVTGELSPYGGSDGYVERVRKAVNLARQARFEHGEHPEV